MASIQEIRSKYPQYNGMSDEDLARALHGKFYSDMDFGEFSERIGLAPAQEAPTIPEGSTLLKQYPDRSKAMLRKIQSSSHQSSACACSGAKRVKTKAVIIR